MPETLSRADLEMILTELQLCQRRLLPHQNGHAALMSGPDEVPKELGRIPEGTITRTVSALSSAATAIGHFLNSQQG
jgi:hypothetical protein